MTQATVRLTGLTHEQLRDVLAACSEARDDNPHREWMPRVSCEGPHLFTAVLEPHSIFTTMSILNAIWETHKK